MNCRVMAKGGQWPGPRGGDAPGPAPQDLSAEHKPLGDDPKDWADEP